MTGSFYLIIGLMLLTLGILLAGLFVMLKGGKLNEKYGNRLMVARVIAQATTVILLVLLFAH